MVQGHTPCGAAHNDELRRGTARWRYLRVHLAGAHLSLRQGLRAFVLARACFTPASVQLKGRVSTDFALELGYDFFWGVCAVRARANKQVSVGGFVIMDDYFDWTGCRTAVDDFRSKCAYFACVLGSESKLVVMFFRYCAIPLRQYDDVLGDGRFKSRASCETSNRSISVLSLQGSKSDSRYLTDGM